MEKKEKKPAKKSKLTKVVDLLTKSSVKTYKLPDVLEIHQVGNVTCPPCNIVRLAMEKLRDNYPNTFKFQYIDSYNYKTDHAYDAYKVEYQYIPKLYVIIDGEPIFIDPDITHSPTLYVTNHVFLYLSNIEPDGLKGLLKDLNIE